MICTFIGGFADGCLGEFPFEPAWVDGTPPAALWAISTQTNPHGVIAATHHSVWRSGERYILVRVDKSEEYQNMVYVYQHHKLDTDFMARTSQQERSA